MQYPFKRCRINPCVGNNCWRSAGQHTPEFFLGKSHRQWKLMCSGSWGCRVRHNWSGSTYTHTLKENLSANKISRSTSWGLNRNYSISVTLISRCKNCLFSFFLVVTSTPWSQVTIHKFHDFLFWDFQRKQNYSPSYLVFFSPCSWSLCLETCSSSWPSAQTPTSTPPCTSSSPTCPL